MELVRIILYQLDAHCFRTLGIAEYPLPLRRAGSPYQLTTRELTERTQVTAGAISQRVARAERAGLVQRAGAGDGSRAVVVTLASTGHALVESLVERVMSRETELISCLTPPQRATLIELLWLLLDDVQSKVELPQGARRNSYTQVGST